MTRAYYAASTLIDRKRTGLHGTQVAARPIYETHSIMSGPCRSLNLRMKVRILTGRQDLRLNLAPFCGEHSLFGGKEIEQNRQPFDRLFAHVLHTAVQNHEIFLPLDGTLR